MGGADPIAGLLEQWRALPQARRLPAEIEAELPAVWAASEFLARACLRDPDWLPALAQDSLLRPLAPGEMEAALQDALAGCADEEDLARRLRRFRRHQMVRIVWRDLSRRAPLGETLDELSELADVCIRQALDHLHAWACDQWGVPRDAQGRSQQLVVLALGKLGARELNLSSDIDLLFAFPEHGQTDGRRPQSNEQFFTRLGRRLAGVLARITEEGFVFRVDLRLRPFGEAGPLAVSFDALENYYHGQARTWERYAMIKARPVTGEADQRERLMAILRPFVYRRYVDFGVLDAIREMKRMIEAEMHKRGMDANIKLGRGGIREIEFIGQALQLVHGGRDPALQVRGILAALERLGGRGLLPEDQVEALTVAYRFLRLTENRLQAWRDEQTHLLPEDPAGRLRLARAMDFDDWGGFQRVLDRHRARVEQIFTELFAQPTPPPTPWEALWLERSEAEAARRLLAEGGFADPETALRRLADFRAHGAVRALSEAGRARLDRLMPRLLEAATRGPDPDATLARLLELLQALVRRSAYLDLLLENPQVEEHLVRLLAASPWIARQLRQWPVLLDELLDPRALYAPLRRAELAAELRALLERLPRDDLEQQMERLRQFAAGHRLRVAAADLADAIPLTVVSDHLTELAEAVLEAVLGLAWDQMAARHGLPGAVDDPGLLVIGYGKLGGIELGYGSDLDLVFLHPDHPPGARTSGPRAVPNEVFYTRVAQRMIHLLTTRTPSGILYEVDSRLRPHGQSGPLVSSLEAFSRYQHDQAWTWEHQALVRARPVAGPPPLADAFDALRRRVLQRPRDADELRRDVVTMREKMRRHLDRSDARHFDLKQGRGGITDIEFMVQYAVLKEAAHHPELTAWTDDIRLLETLAAAGLMTGEAAEGLILAYQRLRHAAHRCTLAERPARVPRGELVQERALVERQWAAWMERAA